MKQNVFSPMELDAIGEIMNISLGSSATAVSNMLDHRVDITTPSVSVVPVDDFTLGELEPAIGVEIKYVAGLEGSNIMLLKRNDVKTIVEILMGTQISDEEFELNDLTVSAVCEVMNQMMGAASTALSDFLGRPVNISTPQSFTMDNLDQFKKEHFQYENGLLVVVRFELSIEHVLKSEFVNVMSVDLARELIAGFGIDLSGEEQPQQAAPQPQPGPAPAAAADSGPGGKLSQEEIERLMAGAGGAPAAAPQPAPSPAAADGGSGGKLSQEEIERLMAGAGGPTAAAPQPEPVPIPQSQYQQSAPQYQPRPEPQYQQPGQPAYQQPPQYVPQPVYAPSPKLVSAKPVQLPELDVAEKLGKEQAENLELIMSVPLEVSVEIGRTRRKVEDILTLSKGSLVVLDKLAGDQVDLFVNGLCVAKGDVVVVDDNFGVRITEVLKRPEVSELTRAD